MRILMLTPQLPFPPDKGTRIRNFGLLRELSRRHEVGVLSFGERDPDGEASLERHCQVLDVLPAPPRPTWRRLFEMFTSGEPDLARRLAVPAMGHALARALTAESWDILQVEGLEMTPHWLGLRCPVPPVVLDAHNAEWLLQARAARADRRERRLGGFLYSSIQAARLRRFEGRAVDSADGVVVVSRADGEAVRSVGCPRHLEVVPNAVDTEAIRPRDGDGDGRTVLFTGSMDYRPNVDAVTWFGQRVWPTIRERHPRARFVIAGRQPHPRVRALASEPGIEVTGAVADMVPLFRSSAVYVAPFRMGGGIRLKLLEAFAHGVPLVTTTMGADGVDLRDGEHALVADDPAALSAAVVSLLEGSGRGRSLARSARALVESHYDWRVVVPGLERLYVELRRARGTVAGD